MYGRAKQGNVFVAKKICFWRRAKGERLGRVEAEKVHVPFLMARKAGYKRSAHAAATLQNEQNCPGLQ